MTGEVVITILHFSIVSTELLDHYYDAKAQLKLPVCLSKCDNWKQHSYLNNCRRYYTTKQYY
jgi:hypothetical protein